MNLIQVKVSEVWLFLLIVCTGLYEIWGLDLISLPDFR